MHEIRRKRDIAKGNLGRIERLAVLRFVAMRGNEVGAIARAINGDLALGAAADRANGFAFGRAESRGFALIADRALFVCGHGVRKDERSGYENERFGANALRQFRHAKKLRGAGGVSRIRPAPRFVRGKNCDAL
jgi:hypothetical protein